MKIGNSSESTFKPKEKQMTYNENEAKQHREPKVLPNDRQKALAELCNTPQERNKVEQEIPVFQLYLNFAVSNIQQIAGVVSTDEAKVGGELKAKGTEAIRRITVREMPVVVALDSDGNDLYAR